MKSEESQLVGYLLSLPPTTNPFLASADYLQKALEPHKMELWARHILIFMIFGYLVMWAQGMHLLYLKARSHTLRLFEFTHLGLIRIDVSSMSGIAYVLYPPLVITDLILQLLIELGHRDMTNKLPLFVCKFLVLLTGSWCFLWVCACQCASTIWGEAWSEAVQRRRRLRLPLALRWSLNLLFVILSLLVIPLFIWATHAANRDYASLKLIHHAIVRALQKEAPGYDPAIYSPMKLLSILAPARKLVTYRDDMANRIKFILWVGLVDLCLLSMIYIPVLIISLTEIQKRTREAQFTMTTVTAEESTRFVNIQNRLATERHSLVQHALAIYFTTIIFIPVIAWQLYIAKGSFLQDRRWLTGTQVGMHLPFLLSGNIVVLILNLQARRFFKARRGLSGRIDTFASTAEKASGKSSYQT